MYNAENYKSRKLNEQQAVVSKDYDERLKGYLDNEDFLEILSDAFKGLEHGETTTTKELAIDGKEFGLMPDDVIHIEVNKENEDDPKFTMWVVDDEYVFDGVDMKKAAGLFMQSTKGEYGVIGTVGNYLGSLVGLGDAGDDGTDEEKLVGVAGALGAIATEKRLDPKVYFDALADKVGNISGKLETEFSGRAEATALNLFRRNIPDSWTRGTNLASILGDVALTIGTLGIGTAGRAALKGGQVATKTLKYSKGAGKAASVAGKGKKLSGLQIASRMKKAWKTIKPANKAKKFEKAFPIGSEVKYITKSGEEIAATVKTINTTESGKVLIGLNNMTPVSLDNLVLNAGKSKGIGLSSLSVLVPNTASKIAATGGVVSASQKAESMKYTSMNPAELMGYYDSLTADPSSYIKGVKEQDTETLAHMILDLKEGSGFWGNTTDQEELALALIITSLSPNGANKVKEEYEQIDPGNTVYAVLDDELGGDMGRMAKVWWAALTGDGADSHPEIAKYKAIIGGGNPFKAAIGMED